MTGDFCLWSDTIYNASAKCLYQSPLISRPPHQAPASRLAIEIWRKEVSRQDGTVVPGSDRRMDVAIWNVPGDAMEMHVEARRERLWQCTSRQGATRYQSLAST